MYNLLNLILIGVSVLEMVKAFEDASGVKIPLEMAGRRPGDVAESYATCDLAEKELGFKCKYTLFDMCKCQIISSVLLLLFSVYLNHLS